MPAPLDPTRVLRQRARRGLLDRSGAAAVAATRAAAALHATDPATVLLSVHARLPPRPVAERATEMKRALEEDRRLLRLMGMRRTLHVVARELAPAVLTVARERLDGQRRKDAAKHLAQAGARDLDALRAEILAALAAGDLDTGALQAAVPDLARRVSLAEGKSYAADAPVSRFVLEALSTSGDLVRARATGGWRASGNTWARLDRWVPDLSPAPPKVEGYAQLAAAWLGAFGPGTVDDLAWWAGIPKGEAQAAISALGKAVVSVEVRGWPGARYALADAPLEDAGPPLPPALLPALDPAGMCWQDRGPFLDPDLAGPLWDRSGNLAPTVWLDGRIIGGWACTPAGRVVFQILDPSAAGAAGAVAEAAAGLEQALAGEVVAPRFPTPLVRALSQGA